MNDETREALERLREKVGVKMSAAWSDYRRDPNDKRGEGKILAYDDVSTLIDHLIYDVPFADDK